MANLNLNGDVSKKEEILHSAYNDLITFGKLFSPQDFLASATPNFHRKVGGLLIDKDIQQLALVLPRDHAKSTLAACAVGVVGLNPYEAVYSSDVNSTIQPFFVVTNFSAIIILLLIFQ